MFNAGNRVMILCMLDVALTTHKSPLAIVEDPSDECPGGAGLNHLAGPEVLILVESVPIPGRVALVNIDEDERLWCLEREGGAGCHLNDKDSVEASEEGLRLQDRADVALIAIAVDHQFILKECRITCKSILTTNTKER